MTNSAATAPLAPGLFSTTMFWFMVACIFAATEFGGIIMHGMNNFGIITRMLTDWLFATGGVHRRLETRWRAPVRPGDTIVPSAIVTSKKTTARSRWATLDVGVVNQRNEVVATGEAMVEFPHTTG